MESYHQNLADELKYEEELLMRLEQDNSSNLNKPQVKARIEKRIEIIKNEQDDNQLSSNRFLSNKTFTEVDSQKSKSSNSNSIKVVTKKKNDSKDNLEINLEKSEKLNKSETSTQKYDSEEHYEHNYNHDLDNEQILFKHKVGILIIILF